MIRKQHASDLPALAKLWLESNIDAHSFIPAAYWQKHFDAVRTQLAQAELYVWDCEDGTDPQGFIGMDGNYIAGLFVQSGVRSQGVGKALLDFVKPLRNHLELCVYRSNTRAVRFYLRENFVIQREQTDSSVGEAEYVMVWNR